MPCVQSRNLRMLLTVPTVHSGDHARLILCRTTLHTTSSPMTTAKQTINPTLFNLSLYSSFTCPSSCCGHADAIAVPMSQLLPEQNAAALLIEVGSSCLLNAYLQNA